MSRCLIVAWVLCAWVLWQETTTFVGGSSSWVIRETVESKPECARRVTAAVWSMGGDSNESLEVTRTHDAIIMRLTAPARLRYRRAVVECEVAPNDVTLSGWEPPGPWQPAQVSMPTNLLAL